MLKMKRVTRHHVLMRAVVGRDILAGKAAADVDAPKIAAAVAQTEAHAPVILDFKGIGALSPSYFRTALLPLWAGPRTENAPPVLANLSDDILEDVRLAVETNKAAIWIVRWGSGAIEAACPVGVIDALDRQALEVALAEGQTDAADLFQRDRSIGVTAWSTRLGTLHQKGLLRRRKDGRRMTYAPPWNV